jgi:hypothetical protein
MRTPLALLLTALSVAAVTVLAPRTAQADESSSSSAERPSVDEGSTWYGYQTLATDGVAVAMGLGSAASGPSRSATVFGTGAVLTYGLGGPIVHFAHGEIGRGFGDLGIRVGAPVVLGLAGALLGGLTAPSSSEPGKSFANGYVGVAEGAEIGLLAGAVTASAIDAILLAHDDARAPAPSTPPAARMAPGVSVARESRGGGRATLGLSGTF